MKKITLLIVLLMFCLRFQAKTQTIIKKTLQINIKALRIGDNLPDELWNLPLEVVNHPEGKKTITLNDYKGKLIILDFWATWCSACIGNFPKLDTMQKKFKDEIKVLLVDYENRAKVSDFLSKRNKEGRDLGLTSIVQDTVLNKSFDHKLIPHYVWINSNGVVEATTSSRSISAENIQKVLKNNTSSLAMKIDQDIEKPLFSSDDMPLNKLLQYSLLIKGYLEGTGSSTRIRKNKDKASVLFTNESLLSLYKRCFRVLDKDYEPNRLSVQVIDSNLFFPEKSKLTIRDWYKDNGYSYNLVLPAAKADFLYQYMLDDLNRSSPLTGRIQSKRKKCLVLIKSEETGDFNYYGGTKDDTFKINILKLNKVPISDLIRHLNTSLSHGYPIINETGYQGLINIQLQGKISDLSVLKEQLLINGLVLKEEERVISEYIIEDKPAQ